MNQIEIFNSPEFGSIRTVEENGKYLFCGADVAKSLGYKDTVNALKTPVSYTHLDVYKRQHITRAKDVYDVMGDPTEVAVLVAAAKAGVTKEAVSYTHLRASFFAVS